MSDETNLYIFNLGMEEASSGDTFQQLMQDGEEEEAFFLQLIASKTPSALEDW